MKEIKFFVMNDRPHPGPLPLGEGASSPAYVISLRRRCNCRRSPEAEMTIKHAVIPNNSRERRMSLPLLGGEGRGEGGCHLQSEQFRAGLRQTRSKKIKKPEYFISWTVY
jgi:hypothetical protein